MDEIYHAFNILFVSCAGVLMLVLVGSEILCGYILIVTQQESLVALACLAVRIIMVEYILLICY